MIENEFRIMSDLSGRVFLVEQDDDESLIYSIYDGTYLYYYFVNKNIKSIFSRRKDFYDKKVARGDIALSSYTLGDYIMKMRNQWNRKGPPYLNQMACYSEETICGIKT